MIIIFLEKIAKNRPEIVDFWHIFQNFRLRRSSACLRRFLYPFGFAARLTTTDIDTNEQCIHTTILMTVLIEVIRNYTIIHVFNTHPVCTRDSCIRNYGNDTH